MEWLKKHTDSIATIGVIVGAVIWMNGRFNEMDNRFSTMEKEMAIIKTVLVMKDMMPKELACNGLEE